MLRIENYNFNQMLQKWDLIGSFLTDSAPQTTTPEGDGDLHDEQQHISVTEQ